MIKLIVRRAIEAIPVLLFIIAFTFLLARFVPGGPFDKENQADPEVRRAIEAYYGLDKSVGQQFLSYMGNFLKGDLGPSIKYQGSSVNELLFERIPVSIELGVLSILTASFFGIMLGIIAAVKQNTMIDNLLTSFSTLGICMPSFIIGPLLILFFGLKLNWFQVVGWHSWSDRVLPVLTLAFMYVGYIARLTRGSILEVIKQNFICTAKAKGLGFNRIFFVHALKNAIAPVINYIGPSAAAVISGSLIVEALYYIPGVGSLFITAVCERDDAVIIGTVLFFAVLVVICNLLVDITLIFVQPRLSTKK